MNPLKRARVGVFSALIAIASALPSISEARPFEVFVDIQNEEDLYDLQETGVIDAADFENLVEILQRGVDLNEASRRTLYALPNLTYAEVDAILAYRDEVGRIIDPASMVINGVISEEKLNAIAIFLIVGSAMDETLPVSGRARIQTRYSLKDEGLPATAMQVRARGPNKTSVGLVALNTRLQVGNLRYDPIRDALTAEDATDRVQLRKLFVAWEKGNFSAIAGTFRAGFGQRLTFDNTDNTDPDGFYGDSDVFRGNNLTRNCKLSTGELDSSPCPQSEGYTYVTPDFRSRDGLLGLALSYRDLEVGGDATLDAHVFGSYQPRQIYQYELYSPTMCEDPTLDTPECSAPDVFRTASNPLEPSPEHSFQTLPNVYAEQSVGGHLNLNFDRRTRVGVTGYAARPEFLVEGIELDFQEWSALPYGGGFGAVGIDAAKGFGNTDVFAEISRSFDGMPSGGGLGALVRAVTAWDKNEVETSLRYYDKDFANPKARPIAAPDEYDGLRARDEIGGRVRYNGVFDKRLRLRGSFDYWHSPSQETREVLTFLRGDLEASDQITVGLWSQFQDKDLRRSGRDQCFIGNDPDEGIGPNGPISCAGQRIQNTGRLRYNLDKSTWINLQAQHEFQDDQRYDDKYRQDIALVAILTTKPSKDLRLRMRSRFLYEDISDNGYLERSWWTYADVTLNVRDRDRLRFRYDVVAYLDSRSATELRTPNPEHWLRVDYEAKF